MGAMPSEEGVVDKILSALVSLAETKLRDDIDSDDISRAVMIKVGPRQDDPEPVVVLFHENDPYSPDQWTHFPVRYARNRPVGGLVGAHDGARLRFRPQSGYEQIGGGSRYGRAFSAEIEVWGDYISGVDMTRERVRHVASVVENRLRKALHDAGPKIGTGDIIRGDFGEYVLQGPYFGESWVDQEEGEAMIVRKVVRFYYLTVEVWNTSAW